MEPELPGYPVAPFSTATVSALMHHGVVSCTPDASLTAVARAMQSHGVHCVLVTGIEGAETAEHFVWAVLTDTDLLAAVARGGRDQRAGDVAATDAPTVEPGFSLQDAARIMAEQRVSHLIVVDPETERPIGVIASSDVVRSLALGS